MKNKLALLAGTSALICLILASGQVIEGARYSLDTCANLIVPSLFPFFVVTGLLNSMGFTQLMNRLFSKSAVSLFGISGNGAAAFITGLCGGYPMGCVYIVNMYEDGQISADEAERLLGFCNNSGPAFIVGVIGSGVFHSVKYGIILYIILIISAILTGMLLKDKKAVIPNVPDIKTEITSPLKAFTKAVQNAITSTLSVCGFIVTFSVFTSLLKAIPIFSKMADKPFICALIQGIIELGSGAAALTALEPSPAVFSLAAFLIGWGGICVHMQSMALIADTKIKGTLHFTGHLLCAAISAAITYLVFCIENQIFTVKAALP